MNIKIKIDMISLQESKTNYNIFSYFGHKHDIANCLSMLKIAQRYHVYLMVLHVGSRVIVNSRTLSSTDTPPICLLYKYSWITGTGTLLILILFKTLSIFKETINDL